MPVESDPKQQNEDVEHQEWKTRRPEMARHPDASGRLPTPDEVEPSSENATVRIYVSGTGQPIAAPPTQRLVTSPPSAKRDEAKDTASPGSAPLENETTEKTDGFQPIRLSETLPPSYPSRVAPAAPTRRIDTSPVPPPPSAPQSRVSSHEVPGRQAERPPASTNRPPDWGQQAPPSSYPAPLRDNVPAVQPSEQTSRPAPQTQAAGYNTMPAPPPSYQRQSPRPAPQSPPAQPQVMNPYQTRDVASTPRMAHTEAPTQRMDKLAPPVRHPSPRSTSAVKPSGKAPVAARPASKRPAVSKQPVASERPAAQKRRINLASVLLTLTIIGVVGFFLALIGGVVSYIIIAAELPPAEELRAREPKFASSQIIDRDGNLLYEMMDQNAGKRTYVRIAQIDRELQLATVATEDRNFYSHVGFDPIALTRAIYYVWLEGEIVSGGSTITQQVARNILLDSQERTASRKIKEIILAAELNRRYSKDEILEIYLNNNNYGNLAYGVDAAARTYFGTSAANLTLGQAAFLAGVPQSPTLYDPYSGGHDAALKRQKVVLSLMVEAGFITQTDADQAAAEMEAYVFPAIYTGRIPAPHFVFYVRQWIEDVLGPEALYTGIGLRIHTSLDARLQSIAEEEILKGVTNLAGQNVTNGALVAIEPTSGRILAMVGSVDFYNDAIGGQVNVTLRCRQPGSAIKPLTYLSTFEKGWTPATIAWDVPSVYTDTAGNVYEPVNYDGTFRGATSVRAALANSLNVPAVKALEFVGVDSLLDVAERLVATSLVSPQLECPDYPYDSRPYYGLALTLGGGEMKPLELVRAYATLANGGFYVETTPVLWVEDNEGNVLLDYRQPESHAAVNPELAYLITHILSDTKARCLAFTCPSLLELADRPVAAKTGTTNDNRDAWAVGYTPDIAAGVWVGNNDNAPMAGVGGASGAAPIWNAFMTRAHEGLPVHTFSRPAGVVEREVCKLSGTEPSSSCPERQLEVFSLSTLPPKSEQDWFQEVELDGNTGLRANDFCRTHEVIKVMLDLTYVADAGGRKWLRDWGPAHGYEIAPETYCTASSDVPVVTITRPQEGAEAFGLLELYGTVDVPDFEHYEITYGVGEDPGGWGWISGPHLTRVRDDLIGTWNIPREMEPGVYTVRILAYNTFGAQFEARVSVNVVGPTPTPTPLPTSTSLPTVTPPPTATPLPTATPPPTATSLPTLIVVVTDTPLPSPTPEVTMTPFPSPTSEVTATLTLEPSLTPTITPTLAFLFPTRTGP
ncbi:MAG: transglycosylase domain-containing protein [Anaerolineae bacterium]|nr:transglycosylase domain-containing protein [Anaerolineae bacterium]